MSDKLRATTVARHLLDQYAKEHPQWSASEKQDFLKEAAAAAKNVLKESKALTLKEATKLTEQQESFTDKYRCGVIRFGSITSRTPSECLSFLDPSFKIPDNVLQWQPEKIGVDPKLSQPAPKSKIVPIRSEDPEEIRRILKKENPEAYKIFTERMGALSFMRNRMETVHLKDDDFLKIIAQLTSISSN